MLRDPVHGDVELTHEELRLIDTAGFQRLRGVKQLGTANLVYVGATHSRFEHSIGTVEMVERLLDAVDRNAEREPASCHKVTHEERRILRVAALLHDVTHIPFGHNIEDQTGLLERHDVPARYRRELGDTELGEALAGLGIRDEVLSILTGEGPEVPPFWRQVLSDTIDADLMDYLRRDAYYTGLELRYDDRVRNYFRVGRREQRMFVDCEKGGMLREDISSELLRMLETRYHFSERVYYHHAKISAGALIARMVEAALRSGAIDAETLMRSTDESLLLDLERADLGDAAETARLRRFMRAFRGRRLPKRVLVLPAYANAGVQDELLARFFGPGSAEVRRQWELELEQEAKARFGKDIDLLLCCPAGRMQLKEARTLVRFPGHDEPAPLEHFADQLPRLRDLRDCYPRLWKLYLFTDEPDRKIRRELQQLALERLPAGCVNALRL